MREALDEWLPLGQHAAYFFLHVTEVIGCLLSLAAVGGSEHAVHVTDVLRDDLGEHGGTLLLSAVFQYLLLAFVECDAHSTEGTHLTLHHLAEHVTDIDHIVGGDVQPFLLGCEVVHGWNKELETLALAEEGGYLLRTGQLHLITNDAKFLLFGSKLPYLLNILFGGAHALAHDGLQAQFCLFLYGEGLGHLRHGTRQRAESAIHALYGHRHAAHGRDDAGE